MDLAHIEDVVRSNILAVEPEVTDGVFNIASGSETSLNQPAAVLLEVMGSNLQPEYGPERKVNAVLPQLADVGKVERLLGFTAKGNLEDGLSRLVDWWRANKLSAAA